MPEQTSMQTRQAFETKARAECWSCTMCGKAIEYEDRDAYLESKRCRRCHEELDPDSGPVPKL